MSPSMRSASAIVMRPPRLGTSCHIRWLDFVMSIGFTRKKVATYSTLPFAFLDASRMSVMTRLWGSSGSSSPNARPASVSYCPALPNDLPSKAGETFLSMTMRFTSAWAPEAHTRSMRAMDRYLITTSLQVIAEDGANGFTRSNGETETHGADCTRGPRRCSRFARHGESKTPRTSQCVIQIAGAVESCSLQAPAEGRQQRRVLHRSSSVAPCLRVNPFPPEPPLPP